MTSFQIHLLIDKSNATSSFCMHQCLRILGPQDDGNHGLFPQDGMVFDDGMLPFHCACRAGAPQSFLNWWWKKCPDVVLVITMDTGDTSLHCYLSASHTLNAASHGQRQQYFLAIQFLVEKHPDALHSINKRGMLPFQMAAICQAPLDVLFYLACQNPGALLHGNSNLAFLDPYQVLPKV